MHKQGKQILHEKLWICNILVRNVAYVEFHHKKIQKLLSEGHDFHITFKQSLSINQIITQFFLSFFLQEKVALI